MCYFIVLLSSILFYNVENSKTIKWYEIVSSPPVVHKVTGNFYVFFFDVRNFSSEGSENWLHHSVISGNH